MKVRLLVALLAVAVAGCAPTRNRPATWPNGWELNTRAEHECIYRGPSTTCILYSGPWKVGTMRLDIGGRWYYSELTITVRNETGCTMQASFDIGGIGATERLRGTTVLPTAVGPYQRVVIRVPLDWRYSRESTRFLLDPKGPISCQ